MTLAEDIAIRHQLLLERLKVGQALSFNMIVIRARDATLESLSALRGTPLASLSRFQIFAVIEKLQSRLDGLGSLAMEEFTEELQAIAIHEGAVEVVALEARDSAIDPEGEPATFALPASQALWQAVLDTPLSATGELLEPWLRATLAAELALILALYRRAHAEGWTWATAETALLGLMSNRNRDGLLYTLTSHLTTMVHTAVQHTSTCAREAVWRTN